DSKIPNNLFGDNSKIRQVLLNLLNNAAQYTEKGSIELEVSANIKNTYVDLTFKVKDTGNGMDSNQTRNLFEASKDKVKIGLSIVKKLVDALQGKIVVESEVNKGSIFTFMITQKIISDDPIGTIDLYATEGKKNMAFNANGKKILVIDDNKLNLKVATRLLEPYKVIIDTASNGEEGINLINTNKYDLILLDQMMPEMDGIQTLKKLKENKNFDTPVIVLTADAIVGAKENYLKEGFDDYLSKPIDTKQLNILLKKYLRKDEI
ncbi:MAG: response regulator, partial [Bacilli bacterium]|nr:response regulator [Bacilli bacterium]